MGESGQDKPLDIVSILYFRFADAFAVQRQNLEKKIVQKKLDMSGGNGGVGPEAKAHRRHRTQE